MLQAARPSWLAGGQGLFPEHPSVVDRAAAAPQAIPASVERRAAPVEPFMDFPDSQGSDVPDPPAEPGSSEWGGGEDLL